MRKRHNCNLPDMSDLSREAKIAAIRDHLVTEGLTPSCTHSSQVRDPGWADDLAKIVDRATPHEVIILDQPTIVSLKLDTLVAEYDSNGEICAWMFEES